MKSSSGLRSAVSAAPCTALPAVAAALVLLCFLMPSSNAWAERPRVYAVTEANVVTSPGSVIERGTVVIRDGRIEAVGRAIPIPPDAEPIDATGRWVYAGLIDAYSRLGLASADDPPGDDGGRGAGAASRRAPAATPGAVHPLTKIRPETRVRDSLLPFADSRKREMERMRNLGFTTVLVVPQNGLLRGRSVAVQLAEDRPVSELILRDDVAQHVAFERGRFGDGYPSSLMGALAALRQTLLDAQRYATWSSRHTEHPQAMRRPEIHAAFEALGPVLVGEQPLFFEVDDPDDTLLAHRIGEEFGLEVAIYASGHEWEITEQIAATGRVLLWPVAFPDKPDVDDEHEALDVSRRALHRYLDAAAGPGRLHAAGVRLALTTRGVKNRADIRKNLRKMIDNGLPADVALAALTTVPAGLLGVERMVGTIEPGKIANLLVADGPLFEEKTQLQHVFVDGVKYDVESAAKPQGDPNAIVDPRGSWSVVFEMGPRSIERSWTISGDRDSYAGTAETRSGSVTLEEVTLEGNALTVVFPARAGRGTTEITVIVVGDEFEGVTEMGPRSVELKGVRTSGPEDRP